MKTKIGGIIKSIRISNSLTQKNIYTDFCSRKEISRIENGKVYPSFETLVHLYRVLRIDIGDLIHLSNMEDNNYKIVDELFRLISNFKINEFKSIFNTSIESIKINKLSTEGYYHYLYLCIINSYISKDIGKARDYFELLAIELKSNRYYYIKQEILDLLFIFVCGESAVLQKKLENFNNKNLALEDELLIYLIGCLDCKYSQDFHQFDLLYQKFQNSLGLSVDLRYYIIDLSIFRDDKTTEQYFKQIMMNSKNEQIKFVDLIEICGKVNDRYSIFPLLLSVFKL